MKRDKTGRATGQDSHALTRAWVRAAAANNMMNTKELTRRAREAVVDVFYEYAEVYVQIPANTFNPESTMPPCDITRLARLMALEEGLSEAARIMDSTPFPRRSDGERSPTDPGAHQWLRTLLTDITELSETDDLDSAQVDRIRRLLRLLDQLTGKGDIRPYPV